MNFVFIRFVLFLLWCDVTNSITPHKSWKWLVDTEHKIWQYCQYHDQLINNPDPKFCDNFICWESQFTDSTRYLLTVYYNAFRILVAEKLCHRCKYEYQNINFIEYHWYLEYIAQSLIKTRCELSIPPTTIELNVEDVKDAAKLFPRSKYFEYAATSMPFSYKTQYEWVEQFLSFLDPETGPDNNILGDFNKEDFRRGTAFFFGCAIVVRSGVSGRTGIGKIANNERVLHLLCVYSAWLPFSSQRGGAHEEKCEKPVQGPVEIADAVFHKNGPFKLTICRRITHIPFRDSIFEEMPEFISSETEGETFRPSSIRKAIEDIPCQVYLPEYVKSPLYRGPCQGEKTESWNVPSVLQANYTVCLPYTDNTPIPKTLEFVLAEFKSYSSDESVLSTVILISHGLDKKFCFILVLFYFVILSCFFLLLSLIFKYHIEQNSYEKDLQLIKITDQTI